MKPRPAPDDTYIATMATELRVLVGQFKRRFREKVNLGDLTTSQLAVLRRLDSDGPATVTTLARAEGMRPQSMGANIAALEAAGLVSGNPDPNDGRQTILSLTAACKEKVKVGRIACDDWLIEAIQKSLSSAEQHELARAVELLKRLIDS
jgi:DNA-binding MarR family transcriptional regulator